MKTYKYRLYPTKQQKQLLADTLECCRVLYNCALEQRKIAYRQFGVSVRRLDQQAELLEIKEYFPEYKKIHSQVLQEVILRVDRSFQNFFRRLKNNEKPGYPRFKGKGWYDSFTYPQSGFSLSANSKGNQRLKLSKIGEVKIKLHRVIKGTIKTCTIKREADKWYVCFSCEVKLMLVNPRNTSQICSNCGKPVPKGLSVRVHKCPHCGLVLDRDVNAAINILRRGTRPGGAAALAG